MNTNKEPSWRKKEWPEETVKTSREFDQQLLKLISGRIRTHLVGQDFMFLFVRGFGSILRYLLSSGEDESHTKSTRKTSQDGEHKE